MESPEMVRQVHDDYFAAGAEIATANSYGLHRDRLKPFDIEDQFESLHRTACQLAVDARDAAGSGRVAGAMGPTGWSYRPDLAPPAEQAAEIFGEIAAIQAPYVDFLLLETMSSVEQARGGLMGAAVTTKPVWLAVSVDDDDGSRLRSGEAVTDILGLIKEFDVEALLVNCSMPEAVTQAVPLLSGQGIAVGAYANGFHRINPEFARAGASVDQLSSRQDLGPDAYADFAAQWIASGAEIVGGCCEVGPAHIKALVSRFK